MPTFKFMSMASAILAIVLCIGLLIIPTAVLAVFGVEGNDAASFIARRASILFLGLAIISFFGRHAIHSDLRQAVILGMSLIFSCLALLGTAEWLRGFAGQGALMPIAAEILYSAGYWVLWFRFSGSEQSDV